MKTVLFHQHGGPEVLQYTDFPTPKPKSGEALIRLHASALNFVDILVRKGWPSLKLELPHISGEDGAGEIVQLGDDTNGELKVGDHVVINANLGCGECEYCISGKDNMCINWHMIGETIHGTYAEYISVPVKQLYKLPNDFDFHHAAAAALVYLTAWHSLVKRGNLQKNETVLIVGAGGGVNSASIQVAKYMGAQVIVIGSDAKKLGLAESIGADIL
ncbi:MAG TPA: alcohol dehydrogenase catalytic domain-containing protein, partial [Anaerolineales bacterium]|nr:alcohol dehydrogenase catalytic domain-containing protein [Anaerolineales bacterium]